MRQIIGTASNHYDLYDADGNKHPSVELILISMQKEYLCGAVGLSRVETFETDRYYLRVEQLRQIVEDLRGMLKLADEIRERKENQ